MGVAVHRERAVSVDIDLARRSVRADVKIIHAKIGAGHIELRVVMHVDNASPAIPSAVRCAEHYEAAGIEYRRVVKRQNTGRTGNTISAIVPRPADFGACTAGVVVVSGETGVKDRVTTHRISRSVACGEYLRAGIRI